MIKKTANNLNKGDNNNAYTYKNVLPPTDPRDLINIKKKRLISDKSLQYNRTSHETFFL